MKGDRVKGNGDRVKWVGGWGEGGRVKGGRVKGVGGWIIYSTWPIHIPLPKFSTC